MDLGPQIVKNSYQYLLVQSGANPIRLGANGSVNWSAGGVADLTGTQTIGGTKTFSSTIVGSINGNAATVTNGVYLVGDQTIAVRRTFSSTVNASITGNAGSVANGVYVTGNQTIGGVKTFSSTVNANITGNAGSVTSGVYFRLNTPPSQITPEDENKVLLLQYGDSVWFKDDNNVSILLAGSGDEVQPITLNESLTGDNSFTATSQTVTVPAGTYTVSLEMQDYVTTGYTSAVSFELKYDTGEATFDENSIDPGNFLDINVISSGQTVEVFFDELANQSGSIQVTVTQETQFYVFVDFNREGDSSTFIITFTQS
jgi:hypothetical protein